MNCCSWMKPWTLGCLLTLRLAAPLGAATSLPPPAGTWSVISLPQDPGEVISPTALAADAAGNLYVADFEHGWIQKRDAAGNWSLLAMEGTDPGQVRSPSGLAVDAAGNLYVADWAPSGNGGRIQVRDALGHWSTLATAGDAPGQVDYPQGLAVDAAGNLYVADVPGNELGNGRIQERDAQGNWTEIAAPGADLGPGIGVVHYPRGLALDTAGDLYVAVGDNPRVLEYRASGGL